jgi:hypothetical protein
MGASLATIAPAEAKSLWLKCGSQEINLDSTKERFSLTSRGNIYQGDAMFSPEQINFEFKQDLLENTSSKGRMMDTFAYAISRKTLEYTLNESTVLTLTRNYSSGSAKEPVKGKCIIMKKLPTAGNKI